MDVISLSPCHLVAQAIDLVCLSGEDGLPAQRLFSSLRREGRPLDSTETSFVADAVCHTSGVTTLRAGSSEPVVLSHKTALVNQRFLSACIPLPPIPGQLVSAAGHKRHAAAPYTPHPPPTPTHTPQTTSHSRLA